jgi:hypothetical protein
MKLFEHPDFEQAVHFDFVFVDEEGFRDYKA